jgi:hypothetical protein
MKEQNEKSTKDEKTADKPEKEEVRNIEKPKELDPTRYGDWEKNGRCIDF